MRPQTILYDNDIVTRLDDSNTFLIHSSNLELGSLFTPTIFVKNIEEKRVKFDFYKAYKNDKDVILHCEYRSTSSDHKLIVHT